MDFHLADSQRSLRIHFVVNGALFRIQRADSLHVFIAEGKIENIDIFLHPFFVDRFRDDDDAALQEPAEHDLTCRLAVLLGNLLQKRMAEDMIRPFGERSPGFVLDVLFFHEGFFGPLLVPDIGFDLIDGGL